MVLPSAPVEDGDTVSYTYDNSGALAKVTDSATGITTTYYYDFTDRLLRYEEESTTLSHTVGYGYDTINNLTSLVETINGVTHTTSYEYDDDNRITKVLNGETSKSYTYDAYSRVTERTTKHGETTVFTDEISYFAPEESTTATTGQISMLRYVLPGGGLSYSYTYDDNGNILSVAFDNEQARPVIENTSYVYDTANQLIRESNSAAGKTWVWTYDNAGNILSRTEYDYLDTGLTTPLDTVTYSYSDSDSDWGDLLTGYDGNTITSDEIGNMLSDGTWTYTWEHGRQLASMSDGTTTWNYTYNSDGLRTSRSNGTTTYNYIYNGSQLTQMTVTTVDGEETVTDTLYFTYDASGIPMTVTYNDVVYYYVTNIQGDVVAILNSSGNVMVNYAYDAWGNVISALGSNALAQLNPLRYRGYVYDTETELYYLQTRYYNPEIGRFINADVFVSTGQGLLGNNMFCYCQNNPVRYTDATGTRVQIWPVLFRDHRPGAIHEAVQAHIIATGFLTKEYVLPGIGRADIYDPETKEIWEIKHGGSTAEMQDARTQAAKEQIERYVNNSKGIIAQRGHAGAFTGGFVYNCEKTSYLVTYETPDIGVILYYVQEMEVYEQAASYAYLPATAPKINYAYQDLVAWSAPTAFAFLGVGCVHSLLRRFES